ncbi:hypothetical protein [Dyella tabacisoli]|uniref:Vitamin K epoxide reductase domain-containing protein n=1 Tax=Dyella tabacisoli TaxID=2282381 RepID=A0A369UJR0_9GAMM|nr:hypothetical protein [Dyella tabacisoli]RDD80756.1 hypothetical protein DVJ77_16120 [Dyella tabacisoli]
MKTSFLKLSLPWLLIALAALLAAALRYGLIEPANIEHLCEGGHHDPAWCSWRHAVVIGFFTYGYGYAALAAAALALLWKHPFAAWLSGAIGVFALLLYCYEAGALALLIGSLRLLRWQANSLAAGDQHGHRDQQVQAKP